MSERQKDRVYPEAEIVKRLATELPAWKFNGGAIKRVYKTHGWKATLMVVNTIGHLAEAAWHHPDLAVSYGSVEVTLSTHDAKGITDKDVELAKKIDDVVLWRPGLEKGALEGTPQGDARHGYIKYD